MLLIMPLLAQAQADHRWRLMPDSTIQGITYNDIMQAATNRVASDNLHVLAVGQIGAMHRQIQATELALLEERKGAEAAKKAAELCNSDRSTAIADRDRWQRKAQRRGTTVAILTTSLLSFALTLILQR
jgi:hypothetical protein